VLVATAEMAWGMTLAAQLVVIMGTQYFDGTGAGGTDYPVTDLLQVSYPRNGQRAPAVDAATRAGDLARVGLQPVLDCSAKLVCSGPLHSRLPEL